MSVLREGECEVRVPWGSCTEPSVCALLTCELLGTVAVSEGCAIHVYVLSFSQSSPSLSRGVSERQEADAGPLPPEKALPRLCKSLEENSRVFYFES